MNIQEMRENVLAGRWTVSDTLSILDDLDRLQSLNRWIPVSERLPLPAQKADGYYSDSSDLVHVYPAPKNDRAVCYLHYLEKWSCSAEVNVTHWRPLPSSPEEG